MSEVNLMNFPTQLANALGVNLFAGQLLASSIFMALLMLPTLFLAKSFRNISQNFALLVMGFLGLSVNVALGWLPIWTFTIICLIVALFYARGLLGIFRS